MNDRKQHVVKVAHQLFIDKGFQATSIQDILEYSGISKGTFYNYFSSKNELLMAIFKTNYAELDKERNELLIGQNRSDLEIFIKQVEIQLRTNRKNNLISLFEEVMVLNDADLKEYIQQGQLKNISWIYDRLIDIFGEKRKPYLLDSAIMFMGILRENLKYYLRANESNANIGHVVRFSVKRLVKLVDELVESDDQLIQPELFESWLPDCRRPNHAFQKKLHHTIFILKSTFIQNEKQSKSTELLDFIEDELMDSKSPRRFLIESAILSLKTFGRKEIEKDLQQLEQFVEEYFGEASF
ncbi:TetR/AcrR family transcriptional regulator [Neobacillus sp. NRS-1170]|uniref:TetR/AcrR family transcriptional regulator n=1 Tax=Neobacillus sp. NRS-1170 TaxID=3233898 RepID=UPI003D2A3E6D